MGFTDKSCAFMLVAVVYLCTVNLCSGGSEEFGGGGAHSSGLMGMGMGMGMGMCKQISDCPCGLYCVSAENFTCSMDSSNEGDCTCQKGCVLYDRFLTPKEPVDVYGRMCQCGNYIPIVRGRVIWCQKGDWVEQPQNMEITLSNPNCRRRSFW